jgi:dolichyl-phosphate beta-glucosyltransferase
MQSEGWIFDVEILMLAEFAKVPVAGLLVGWTGAKGSKLDVNWGYLGHGLESCSSVCIIDK